MVIQETEVSMPVLGMTCGACVRRVENALAAIPGVVRTDVNLIHSSATVEAALDRDLRAVRDEMVAAIRKAGYVVPDDALDRREQRWTDPDAVRDAAHADERGLRRDAVIAVAFAVPLLVLAMSHGALGVPALPMTIAQAVLGTIVVFGPGRRYLRLGWKAFVAWAPDMNTLIALGAGAAWAGSLHAAVRWWRGAQHHPPELYFEAAAAIVAFVMIGKVLEARARLKLTDAVSGLVKLTPRIAHVVTNADDTTGVDKRADQVAAGDLVRVRPGERVPADGTVIDGTSTIDESLLSGEAMPVEKMEGSAVYAGTVNHTGALLVRVARAGNATALARIRFAVMAAQNAKPPIARMADRIAARFVPAVLVIAMATYAGWVIIGDAPAQFALTRAIAVLVIACPCALGLATPAAIAVGTARGAQLGVLFRSGEALERGGAIDVVAFDKTGTLTRGVPEVTKVLAVKVDEAELIRLAASVEAQSEHPLARAIVELAGTRGITLAPATSVEATPGVGIAGIVDGKNVKVRSMSTETRLWNDKLPSVASVAYLFVDTQPVGAFAFTDPPAAPARAVIDKLRAMRITPVLITGDREEPAREIAAALGVERVHATVSPTGKAALVDELRTEGSVAMVGDGINDAPALAAADLGIAVGTGTDVAAAAADVTLMRGGVALLPTALGLARATMRTIRRNLAAAFLYNVVCIPVAAGALYPVTGWLLSPILASAVMSLSSISVVLSSLRLRSFARSSS